MICIFQRWARSLGNPKNFFKNHFSTPKGFEYIFTKNAPKLPFLVQVPNFRKKHIFEHMQL